MRSRPAAVLVAAFEAALADGVRTRDLGGTAGTAEFTDAVLSHCRSTATSSPAGALNA